MSAPEEKILTEIDGPIGRFTINNPAKRNAMSYEMWREMGDRLEAWGADDRVRVIIFTGAGDKSFCAGNDISEFGERRAGRDGVADYDRMTERAYEGLRSIPKPVIARIDGACIGGGFELAQLCDLQIASKRSRFGVTPAKLGLGYKLSDIQLLLENMPAKRAKELLMTGRLFPAAEALTMGLVNQVVPAEELDSAVDDTARTIAANAPLTVRAAKLIVRQAGLPPGARDLDLCQRLVDACTESEDYLEGQAAFAEKRPPVFKGR